MLVGVFWLVLQEAVFPVHASTGMFVDIVGYFVCLFVLLIVIQEAIAVTGRYFMHTRRMFVDTVGVLLVCFSYSPSGSHS